MTTAHSVPFNNSEDHGHFKCPNASIIYENLMGEYMFSERSPVLSVTEDSEYYSEETQTVDDSTCELTPTKRRVHWPTDTLVTSLVEYPRHLGGHYFPPENPNWVKLGTTSFEADICHGCEQTIDYGTGRRCTICPDYTLCEWCIEYDISTKPHSRSHAL